MSSDRERVVGRMPLEMGADDCLRKPLDPARLMTRVKATLRRAQG
ncbi:MAG: hypothetical protein O2958_01320 [Gemmatimonadetes bacterium]|nr:hypothetical protein [Gemmatimonadota bacterium]MDA1104132.1 hypothetical protein [Gemmatimonadota bacterium]